MTLDPVPHWEPVPRHLRCGLDDVSGVTVLRLAGEIDASETDALRSAFERAIGAADEVLVLDLANVSFIDVAGMTAIIGSMRRAAHAGCEVSVVSAGPRVRKVFAMTGNQALLESSASLVDVTIAASIQTPAEAGGPDG